MSTLNIKTIDGGESAFTNTAMIRRVKSGTEFSIKNQPLLYDVWAQATWSGLSILYGKTDCSLP